jgi:hypothetical protein
MKLIKLLDLDSIEDVKLDLVVINKQKTKN